MIPCRQCGRPSFGLDALCTEHRKILRPKYPDAPGYSNDTTSKAAAESMQDAAGGIAATIKSMLAACPRTCSEIERDANLSHQTASARITWLRLNGHIEDSGEKRRTESGRQAIVWKVKEKA